MLKITVNVKIAVHVKDYCECWRLLWMLKITVNVEDYCEC
jgi:hypothetical protein